jgi:hypothetical protein
MKGRAKQPDKALMRRRVEEILRIRLDGAEWWDCCEFVREKEEEDGSCWHLAEGDKPLSDASLRRYLARADELIAKSCRASRKKLVRRHLAQRRNLYAKALSAGDYRAALACVRDEAELLGLYPPADSGLVREVADLKRVLAEAEGRKGGSDGGDRGAAGGDQGAGRAGAPPGRRPEGADAAGPAAG